MNRKKISDEKKIIKNHLCEFESPPPPTFNYFQIHVLSIKIRNALYFKYNKFDLWFRLAKN